MIVSFGDQATEDFYNGESSKHARSIPGIVAKVARRALDRIAAAESLQDLRGPGLSLERLRTKEGFWSIRVNDQYRVIFRFESANAHDVELTKHYR